MAQIVTDKAISTRCNLVAIQTGGSKANTVLASGEIWLVDTTNANKGTNGVGLYDSYITGDGTTAAKNLTVRKIDPNDVEYNTLDFSGMGKVYLPKNIITENGVQVNRLTQDMFYKGSVGSRVPNTNTVFVVQHDFTLGYSETGGLTFDAQDDKIDLVSAERDLVITEDNLAESIEISGTTYYYLDIPLALNRTFTLLDTTHCKLLNIEGTTGTVSASTQVTANAEGVHVYVASTTQGLYEEAYTISVPYYKRSVEVPANHRIEILDYSHCSFLVESGSSYTLSYDRRLDTSDEIYTVLIASDVAGKLSNVYRITEITEFTIPDNCVLEFDGGSIKDGNIIGTNTRIVTGNVPIFHNIFIGGTWLVPEIYSDWFSEIGTVDNAIKNLLRLTNASITNDIYVKDGNYWVTPNRVPTGGGQALVSVTDYTAFHLRGNLRLRPNNSRYPEYLLCAYEKKHVTIDGGGYVYGDKPAHIYADWNLYPDGRFVTYRRKRVTIDGVLTNVGDLTYEGSHCIYSNSSNVLISDMHCHDAMGDGICLSAAPNHHDTTTLTEAENNGKVIVRNCSIQNTRRQGISVCTSNVIIENCWIKDVCGAAPGAGIDVEPASKVGSTDVRESKVVLRNCYIENSAIGIEIEVLSFYNLANVLVENCRVYNSPSPLAMTKRTRNVMVLNSVFTAGPGPLNYKKPRLMSGTTSDTYYGITWWRETDSYNGIRGVNVVVKDCEFLHMDSGGSDKYMIDLSTGKTENLHFRNSFENCFIYAPNHEGIRTGTDEDGTLYDGYSFSIKSCRIYAKSFHCVSATDASFIEGNFMTLNFARFSNAIVTNNYISMTGPIIYGSLMSNDIIYKVSSANFPTILSNYGYSNLVPNGEKYLFRLPELGFWSDNHIFVETDALDALIYAGSSWRQPGAKPVFCNNYFYSRTNQTRYINLTTVPIAFKQNDQKWFIYFYGNKFNGRDMDEIVPTNKIIFNGGLFSSSISNNQLRCVYNCPTTGSSDGLTRYRFYAYGSTPDYIRFSTASDATSYSFTNGKELAPGSDRTVIVLVWDNADQIDQSACRNTTLKVISVEDGEYSGEASSVITTTINGALSLPLIAGKAGGVLTTDAQGEVKADTSTFMRFNGELNSYEDLPASGVEVGDVRYIRDKDSFVIASETTTDNNLYIRIPGLNLITLNVAGTNPLHPRVSYSDVKNDLYRVDEVFGDYPVIDYYYHSLPTGGDGNLRVIPVNTTEYGIIVVLASTQKIFVVTNQDNGGPVNSWYCEGLTNTGEVKDITSALPVGDNDIRQFTLFGGGVVWTGTQVQPDWNENDSMSMAFIHNKPTIPSAQVQANWNETNTSSLAFIQNKPTIPEFVDVSSMFATNPELPSEYTMAQLQTKNLYAVVDGNRFPVTLKYSSSAHNGRFFYVDYDGTTISCEDSPVSFGETVNITGRIQDTNGNKINNVSIVFVPSKSSYEGISFASVNPTMLPDQDQNFSVGLKTGMTYRIDNASTGEIITTILYPFFSTDAVTGFNITI